MRRCVIEATALSHTTYSVLVRIHARHQLQVPSHILRTTLRTQSLMVRPKISADQEVLMLIRQAGALHLQPAALRASGYGCLRTLAAAQSNLHPTLKGSHDYDARSSPLLAARSSSSQHAEVSYTKNIEDTNGALTSHLQDSKAHMF